MNDEKLIEAVRSYSCLWQVNSYSYKDRRAKDNAWKEVIDKVTTNSITSVDTKPSYVWIH